MSSSNENLIITQEKKENQKNLVPLLFFFKSNVTSQDPQYPLNNLLNKNSDKGWISNRFCTYPQEIIIEFHSYVNIKQINILINETKIPIIIEIINCINIQNNNNNKNNDSNDNKRNNKIEYYYKNIGFIKLSSNIETNYKARELRKIYVDFSTRKIKLIVHRNYYNSYNIFFQVGIVSLDFFGYILNDDKNNEIYKKTKLNYADLHLDEEIKSIDDNIIMQKMDKKSEEKLKELMDEMENKKNCEEYDECKIIKNEIDQLKKINFKIYNLEMYKNDCVKRSDFDNAKKIKKDIDIFKKMLNDYLNKNYENQNEENNDETNNKNDLNENNKKDLNINNNNNINNIIIKEDKVLNDNNNKKLTKKLRISKTQQDIFNYNEQNYDDIVLPTLQKKTNNNINNISNINNNSNSFDNNNTINTSRQLESFNGLNENEQFEKQPLEELTQEIKIKYEILINKIGEEIIQKIFSKYNYYKEEGFKVLNSKIKEIIIDSEKTTQETNKYIVSLINIFFIFLDDKHPSVVANCLELFINVLKAIKERSSSKKTEYDFKITKRILNKIKDKLNHISKIVRLKASELYIYMLETDFCEYNSLILELVEKDVNEYFKKLDNLNNNNYNFQLTTSRGIIGIRSSANVKHDLSKQLIITKMNIFKEIFSNFENNKDNKKMDIKKFPQNIVGDFIIININHPKEEVRDITKEVLIKYIHIFGNQILYKLITFINNKELIKLIQDKEELMYQVLLIKEEEKKKSFPKIKFGDLNNLNNNNKNYSKNKNKNKKLNLLPDININSNIKLNKEANINKLNSEKVIKKSVSQPKYNISKKKIKLKPINNKTKKILEKNINNNSENNKNIDIPKNNFDKIEESKNEDNTS